jgi:hypothetical protein
VFDNLARDLKVRFPWLSMWFGERLEIELPAFLASVTMHGLLLVGLAFVGYHVHQESVREFQSGVALNLKASSDSTYQDLDQTANPPAQIAAAGSFAPNVLPTISFAPSPAGAVRSPAAKDVQSGGAATELIKLDVRRATEMVVPSATMLAQTVSIRGNGAELVGGVEGAVDRIAIEVLRQLEQGRTLVVWAFDASGSLLAERQRLSKHIGTIYSHINGLDEHRLSSDSGLLTMVVSFGQDRRVRLPKPTAEVSEITEAIESVELDTSGVETTFTTVGDIVNRFSHFKNAERLPYHTMIIVVTDEVGDDQGRMEETISLAQRAKVPVYVLGSQAVFGRVDGYVDYVDPKTKYVFRGLAVPQGPESATIEQIRLPFWYGGPQYDVVEAGFGPYALSRLASATGGIYFVTRFDSRRAGFDPARMREYKPDWDSRTVYERKIADSPLRRAVLNAAQITQQQKLPGMPSAVFPPVDAPEFKDVMAVNQAIAERTAYTVDEALVPINSVVKLRDREISRRWQAHYDLIRGRLLAMKVRCYEYNWACARMKKDPPKFSSPKFNAWRLVPDANVQYSEKAVLAAKEAQTLLRRVTQDHPSTPWALLAERDLKDPLGFKWVEAYVQPRPRGNDNNAAQRKNKPMKMAKPPEMPKL